jgi:exopolysaccharide biosynthesis polyprenyl glycosylphosphotransferase
MQSTLRFIDQKKISLFSLVLSDLLFFLISFLCAYWIRNSIGEGIQPINVYWSALPVSFVILVVVFYLFGLYDQKIRIKGFSELYTTSKAVLMTAVLLMAASFLYKYDYSRGFVLLFTVSSLVFLNLGRFFVRAVRIAFLKKGIGIMNVLIIGAGRPGRKLMEYIQQYKNFGYNLIGFLDDNIRKGKSKILLLGKTSDLHKIIKKNKIEIVFVSDPMMPHEKILEMMTDCQHLNVKFKLVSSLYEILSGSIDMTEIEGIPAIDLRSKKKNIFYLIVKRFFDIILSLVGLIVLFPLWILIVILIRLDSPGKALFVQNRSGKDGKIFKMYKFRTMDKRVKLYEEAPTSPDDKRITRIGKFLRKTSLDELPQLINVLKGEMALVGPRPEMPFIVKNYTNWQRKRLEIKPGLTGLWQILGRKDLPLHQNIEYDFYYLQNQSLFLDFVILLKTFWVIITGKGAF